MMWFSQDWNPLGHFGMSLITCLVTCLEAVNMSSSTPSLLSRLCSVTGGECRNGQCYVINQHTRCLCGSMFSGHKCENINMAAVHHAVIGNVVIFQWPRPPRLKGYSFVYYETENPEIILFKKSITMKEHECSVLVGNLKGGRTHYRVCVEDDFNAERALAINGVELLSNCIEITTQPDYHTVAGWVLAAMLACVILLLMYSQREKIEILYFGSKPFVPFEKQPEPDANQNQTIANHATVLWNGGTTPETRQLWSGSNTPEPVVRCNSTITY